MNTDEHIEGWMIIHPLTEYNKDCRYDFHHFGRDKFYTKLDNYKNEVTPEFYMKTYFPDSKLCRVKVIPT